MLLAETSYERTDWEPSLCPRSRQGDRESPKMGQANSAPFRDIWYGPTERPDWKKEPTFDPMAGFPNGRKIRGNLMKKSYRVLEEIRIEDLFCFLFITVFLELHDKLTFSFVYADPQVTPEQLDAYKLPLKRRDYCAYMYIKFLDCRRNNNWPYTPCDIVFSDFEACENEE